MIIWLNCNDWSPIGGIGFIKLQSKQIEPQNYGGFFGQNGYQTSKMIRKYNTTVFTRTRENYLLEEAFSTVELSFQIRRYMLYAFSVSLSS